MNHAERYEYLVNKMAAIRWRGSDLDASYHAALFLMASHPALFKKMDRYLCPEVAIHFLKKWIATSARRGSTLPR